MREGRKANQAVSSLSPTSKDRREEEETGRQHDGPAITFCLPSIQTDPPLLWKVLPPEIPEYPIAVEIITVLDDCLRGLHRSGERPTHIYINGYQSWSFAGSLLRGQPQPKSALPSTWSGNDATVDGCSLGPGKVKQRTKHRERKKRVTFFIQATYSTCRICFLYSSYRFPVKRADAVLFLVVFHEWKK